MAFLIALHGKKILIDQVELCDIFFQVGTSKDLYPDPESIGIDIGNLCFNGSPKMHWIVTQDVVQHQKATSTRVKGKCDELKANMMTETLATHEG